jgi:hypothetical protein
VMALISLVNYFWYLRFRFFHSFYIFILTYFFKNFKSITMS